ncbi:MAG TPA: PPC domain-containing protein, partial [Pirellulales bacterium]
MCKSRFDDATAGLAPVDALTDKLERVPNTIVSISACIRRLRRRMQAEMRGARGGDDLASQSALDRGKPGTGRNAPRASPFSLLINARRGQAPIVAEQNPRQIRSIARADFAHARATLRSSFALVASLILLSSAIQPAAAQLPLARLNSAFPPGGKQGSTSELTLNGTDLDGINRLYFNHPGITAKQVVLEPTEFEPQPHPAAGKFNVSIAGDLPPGMYEVRAAGKYGLSNPRFFVVDTRPEINEIEPNSTLQQAGEVAQGSVVNGVIGGGADRDFFQFHAQKGERLLVDCQARRIDSRLDAALVLYDARGNELASAHDGSHADTLLDFTIPAAGVYVVEVHDFIYAGGPDFFYRLYLGAGPHVDFIFPPAGLPGSKQTYQIYGRNLPGGKVVPGLAMDGRPLEVVTTTIALPGGAEAERLPAGALVEPAGSGIDAIAYRHPSPQGLSNPVLISFATAPVVTEKEPNNAPEKAQKLSPPCECVGQFSPVGDHDWFTFEAKQGDTYTIEVISQRLGIATDPYLVVQQVSIDKQGGEQVKELQQVDDQALNSGGVDYNTAHDDPSFRFTAPADGAYRILLRDLYASSRGDPRFIYRLAIRREQPDFRLTAFPKCPGTQPNQQLALVWSAYLRKGGSDEIEVVAFRRDGFDGEIVVTAEGLPAGVTAAPVTIGPGRTSAALVLTAADNAAPTVASFRLVGKAKVGAAEVTRAARPASLVWAGQPGQFNARARLAGELMLEVAESETAPFTIRAAGNVLEMSRAGKIEIPVNMVQHGDFKGNVTLSAAGLPQNIRPANQQMSVGPGDAKFTLNLQTNAPLGVFSFFLLGTTQYNYRHNPEAAEAAAKHLAEIEKLLTERRTALQTANNRKNSATQMAQLAATAGQQAQQTLNTAKNTAAAAETKLKAAQQVAAQAQTAFDKDKENQSLTEALDTAKKSAAAALDEQNKAA